MKKDYRKRKTIQEEENKPEIKFDYQFKSIIKKYDCLPCDGYNVDCVKYRPIHNHCVSPCEKKGLEGKLQ